MATKVVSVKDAGNCPRGEVIYFSLSFFETLNGTTSDTHTHIVVAISLKYMKCRDYNFLQERTNILFIFNLCDKLCIIVAKILNFTAHYNNVLCHIHFDHGSQQLPFLLFVNCHGVLGKIEEWFPATFSLVLILQSFFSETVTQNQSLIYPVI